MILSFAQQEQYLYEFYLLSIFNNFQFSCLTCDFSSFNLTVVGIYSTFVEQTREPKGSDSIYLQVSAISTFQI